MKEEEVQSRRRRRRKGMIGGGCDDRLGRLREERSRDEGRDKRRGRGETPKRLDER